MYYYYTYTVKRWEGEPVHEKALDGKRKRPRSVGGANRTGDESYVDKHIDTIINNVRGLAQTSNDLREIPDNQEVFAHPDTDQSVILEIMEYHSAGDDLQAIRTYFEDLAECNGSLIDSDSIEYKTIDLSTVSLTQCSCCQLISGLQRVSKFKDRARNTVRIEMALMRLPVYQSDILVTFNNPTFIDPASSSSGAESSASPTAWSSADFLKVVQTLTLHDDAIFG